MKGNICQKSRGMRLWLCLLAAIALVLPFLRFSQKEGGRYAVTASAASGNLIEVQRYDVDMTVTQSRKIIVKERIEVEFLASGLTMFYRSLPTDGCIYSDITAVCVGNEEFYFSVDDNPDMSGFIDINCIGGARRGAKWTYELSYTMQQGVKNADGMTLDVIGFGWSVPLHNVTATLHLPSAVQSHAVYVGGFGSAEEYPAALSEDGKSLTVRADLLEVVHNGVYDESMAKGITVDFTLEKGVLAGYAETRIFTEHMWAILLFACIGMGLAVLLFVLRKKREIITVVNIKPPEGMTPMQMGKIIDGELNNEDITSMVYYFADKGYLKINFADEKDPELIKLVPELPESATAHERTLFKGLFSEKAVDDGRVKVSQLVNKFFTSVKTAKAQVLAPKPMYDWFSKLSFFFGGIYGVLFAIFCGYFMGKQLGGGYGYIWGGFMLLPVSVNLLLAYLRENYRYKWKAGRKALLLFLEVIIALLCGVLFTFCFAEHIMTEWEKAVLCMGALLPPFLTQFTLCRTQKYVDTLGDILGFKDFIVVTEEDKIKFMLETEPELFYKVLPYAQVLGVTNEWEKKFEKLTMEPPSWYEGGDLSLFDYMIINHCITRTMIQAMATAATNAMGGGHIGRSGGGGSFGGFGGGGFGGGGGGAR